MVLEFYLVFCCCQPYRRRDEGEVESKGFTLCFVVVSRTGGETEG